MNKDTIFTEIKKAIIEKTGRMTITCDDAFDISNKLGVKISEVGKVCNSEKIKITKCQLGCF